MHTVEGSALFSMHVSPTCVYGHLHCAGFLDLHLGMWVNQKSSF